MSVSYNFFLKVDDDVLLDPDGVKRLHENVMKNFTDQNVIFGFPMMNSSVHRHGKYSVQESDFHKSKFPDFVLGNFYILTKKAARNIVEQGIEKVSLTLEDVAITGVLRELADVGIVSIKHHIIPSLDYVYGLIKFFGEDLEECVKHLEEYAVVHKQFHNVKNVTKDDEDRIGNWMWKNVWRHGVGDS